MYVKAKKADRVYWDPEQKVTIHGKEAFEVKATSHIRSLINSADLVEVQPTAAQLKAKEAKEAKAAKEAKENTATKAAETA